VAVYFEAAAAITVLVLLGQVLELRARESTSGAIRALLDLAPKTARRIEKDGAEKEIQLEAVQVGDRLRVRPGQKVPVDGSVLEGRSAVDESMVTGESMPVTKAAGAAVIGGTMTNPEPSSSRLGRLGGHHAIAHCATRRRGAAQSGSDSATRRPSLWLVCPNGYCNLHLCFRCLGHLGS